ncbi:MAG: nucleoside triphosphate pyrophosphohydrolase [Bacillota bacterium]
MKKIIVVGLGPGNPNQVTLEAHKYLKSGLPLFFRTIRYFSTSRYIKDRNNIFSFDELYDNDQNLDQVYRIITNTLIKAVNRYGAVCYAVPGHPSVGEAVVDRLCRICPRLGISIQVVESVSALEPILNILNIDLLDSVKVYDALGLKSLKEHSPAHLFVAQVYNKAIASRVKLHLMEFYSEDYQVRALRSTGLHGWQIVKMPLRFLDRKSIFDHYTIIYLPPSKHCRIEDLLIVMDRLRAEDGCPWDRKQDHHSLRQYLIEEAYEVVAAIEREDDLDLEEELGDVLLQVVFHSQIAREEKRFDFNRVIDTVVAKLIRRHPHVFGSDTVSDASQVKILWEQIKTEEKNNARGSPMLSIDHALPALLKAYKLQKKAAESGFDWPCIEGPLDKAREELSELEEAFQEDNKKAIEEELGDYLFTIVNLARFLEVNPELALGKTINKFIKRYGYVMQKAEQSGRPITSFTLEELDYWWNEAKKIGKNV